MSRAMQKALDKVGNQSRLAAHSHRDATVAAARGWPTLARHHQHMAAEHAEMARAYRFAIIAGRTSPTWEDFYPIDTV